MKINIITCHDVYNHGASLQAYALQTYLINLGHNVEIIDYRPDYLSGHYKLCSVTNPVYDRPFIKQLYLMAKLPGRLIALRRKRAFDNFTRKYLRITPHKYHSNNELKANPPEADIYIAGSDQIWNTLFKNGKDPAFYLDFAPPEKIRISYAASFSTTSIQEIYLPFVKKQLQNFHSISIRERSSLPLLFSLGFKGIAVCDPVFLLSKEKWESFLLPQKKHEKYVLVYDFDNNQVIQSIAETIAENHGLKIYNIGATQKKYASKNFIYSGPFEFLSLIHDASFVISNSFHATAFSLIFQRDFCVINRKENINIRMSSLLNDLHLTNRIVSEYSNSLKIPIDYSSINPIIEKDIHFSKQFLYKNIG